MRQPEAGYRITGINHDWQDPRRYQNDSQGTPIGFHAGYARVLNIEITGRLCGEAPVDPAGLPFQFPCQGTVTVANLISGYGITTGGVYLESLQIVEADEEDATFTAQLTRHPHIS